MNFGSTRRGSHRGRDRRFPIGDLSPRRNPRPRSAATTLAGDLFARNLSRETLDAASRVAPGGAMSVAARVVGLVLASPEMQVR